MTNENEEKLKKQLLINLIIKSEIYYKSSLKWYEIHTN